MRRQKLERENQDLISELENLTVIQDQFESLQDEARSASDQVSSLTQRLSQNASRWVLSGPQCQFVTGYSNWCTIRLLIIANAVENSEEVLPLYQLYCLMEKFYISTHLQFNSVHFSLRKLRSDRKACLVFSGLPRLKSFLPRILLLIPLQLVCQVEIVDQINIWLWISST